MSNIKIIVMENKYAEILGLNIKAERTRKNLSQEAFSELINMSVRSISLIENGKQNVSAIKLIFIAKALNVDIKDLIKGI